MRIINSSHLSKKRKLDSQSPLKIEEEPHIVAGKQEEDPEEIAGDEEDEEIEYEEVEYEEEEEEEEEEDEECEEEDDLHNDGDVAEEPILTNNVGGGVVEEPIPSNNGGSAVVEEDENEPIRSVLSAFSKEVLVELLAEAAERHADVAARVRATAVVDPSQRKIFVHGLNWDTTTAILLEEFSKYGEIEDCRVIADKFTGRSKGYGFVLFKTCRAARLALKEPQKLINERMTCSQLASVGPISAALPQKPQLQLPEYTQRKIYVSNVGEELDPAKVKDFFSKFGEIEEGPLGLDKETGKPKGFCLFTFKTVESAKLALAEPHKQFEGVTLHCQQAIDGPKPHKKAAKNLKYVDNVASSAVVDSTMVPVPPYMQSPPIMLQPQPMNVNPAAVGQALTTLLAAQGGGLNLLGALGAMGPATGLLNNSGMVPAFRGPVVQGGFGMARGMNMGSNGMEGSWNSGGYLPNQMRWRSRGRGHHSPWPGMGH